MLIVLPKGGAKGCDGLHACSDDRHSEFRHRSSWRPSQPRGDIIAGADLDRIEDDQIVASVLLDLAARGQQATVRCRRPPRCFEG